MAAVFRTPLGAALLAAEVLYRDDFEAEALVPAVLASVISYSVVISIFGESTLFARAPRYAFIPTPPAALRAARGADRGRGVAVPEHAARASRRLSARLPLPVWARPAVGGLALSAIAVPLILLVGARIGSPGRGARNPGRRVRRRPDRDHGNGLAAGRDGRAPSCCCSCAAPSCSRRRSRSAPAAAPATSARRWCWEASSGARSVTPHRRCSTTPPSIRAPSRWSGWERSTVASPTSRSAPSSWSCELAGSYDLLVPLMLAEGIAFVALRKRSLYEAQVPTHNDSPVHRPADSLEPLARQRVADILVVAHAVQRLRGDDRLRIDAAGPRGSDLADHLSDR